MILRGIDRAHDIDLGPSNGTHTRGPVSGGLVQPRVIPSGRKGAPPLPKARRPNAHERAMLRPRCPVILAKSGRSCRRVASHPGHCKSTQGPIA